jgi:hypothetical protein
LISFFGSAYLDSLHRSGRVLLEPHWGLHYAQDDEKSAGNLIMIVVSVEQRR